MEHCELLPTRYTSAKIAESLDKSAEGWPLTVVPEEHSIFVTSKQLEAAADEIDEAVGGADAVWAESIAYKVFKAAGFNVVEK